MKNEQIAQCFELLADLLEIDGANPFRIRAYRNAARTSHPHHSLCQNLGIGPGPHRTRRYRQGPGSSDSRHRDDRASHSAGRAAGEDSIGVVDMLRIPGVGPKKVAVFFKELKLTSLDELQAAAEAGRLSELKGFGKKTEQAILQNIAAARHASERISIADARAATDMIVEDLLKLPGVHHASAAGSCRRRKRDLRRPGRAGDLR